MLSGRKSALILAPLFAVLLAAMPAKADVREEFHKTVSMDANGTFSLKNVNGGVAISAWEKSEVQIDAVKSARSSEKLRNIRIDVTASGHMVDVKTKYEPGWNNSGGVEYTIHVPKGARLFAIETVNGGIRIEGLQNTIKAKVVNGKLEVWNAAGELELESVNGEVAASLNNAGKFSAKLRGVNGNIVLSVPQATSARVKASTVTGSIQSELPVKVNRPEHGPGASVDSTLGSGGATIQLETVNGTIYLKKI